jgi:hypothetical protein
MFMSNLQYNINVLIWDFTGLTKLIVGGGNGLSTKTVDVIDLSDPSKKCEPLPDFPFGNDGAVGFLHHGLIHHGLPLVCGGQIFESDTYKDTNSCWMLTNANSWVHYNDMAAGHR